MKATEALKKVMELKNVKPSDLCARLGIKSNVLSERFKQKNISVEKLDEMMNVMDYKIVIVPRETRLPEGGFEIE
jgi:transcriptional regulator with XRE-family HTH domain